MSTEQQDTTYLSEAVEAAVKAREVTAAEKGQRYSDGWRRDYAALVRQDLEAAEPFFATHYEQKGREAAESDFVAERSDLRSTLRLVEKRLAAAEQKGAEGERAKLEGLAEELRAVGVDNQRLCNEGATVDPHLRGQYVGMHHAYVGAADRIQAALSEKETDQPGGTE